jgi:uncharacterized protein (TIGR02588 family)
MPSKNRIEKKYDHEEFQKNKLEWTVFAFSSLLLLCLMAYLCYQTFTHSPSAPDLQVTYAKDTASNNLFGYRIYLDNHGGETAEDVMIAVSLLKSDTIVESSTLQIAFSPKRSKREGWISFTANPEKADSIQVKVMSYKKP